MKHARVVRKAMVGATAGLMLAVGFAPAAQSAPTTPSIDIQTTEAVAYAEFIDTDGDGVPDTAFRPHFTAKVEAVCPAGVAADLFYLPVSANQSPTVRFTCTGQPQMLQVLPVGQKGVVPVTTELRLPDDQGTWVVVAQDAQDVNVLDVRPFPPRAPGLTVGDVTEHTVTLNWTPAPGTGIIGYRFGWESESGLPQPTWSSVYPSPPSPFVMTNLCAGCTYHMWLEAVTAEEVGARARVDVTTVAGPPTPVVGAPSPPRSLLARPGTRRARLTWLPSARTDGARVDLYCVRQRPRLVERCTTQRAMVVRGLRNRVTYTFRVRAHTEAGWSGWSNAVRVRPRR